MDNLTGTLWYLRGNLKPIVESSTMFLDAYKQKEHGSMAVAMIAELTDVMSIENAVE